MQLYDGWLKRIEAELNRGGDVKSLVELGIKVADRRGATVRLGIRTTIPPSPDPDAIEAIVDMQIKNESRVDLDLS